jgi:hypothetical protein
MTYELVLEKLEKIKQIKELVNQSGFNAPYDNEMLNFWKKELLDLLELYIKNTFGYIQEDK